MEWFGWLLKPHMQVSFLDHLIMIGELGALLAATALILAGFEMLRKDRKS